MDDSKSNQARNNLQQSNHLENDLWDIEDSWDEENIAADTSAEDSTTEEPPIIDPPSTENKGEPAAENSAEPESTEAPTSEPATAGGIKKPNLRGIEKIALSVVTVLFLGLAIWGYVFLRQQNNLIYKEIPLEFPIEGKHCTVSNLETFWLRSEGKTGIKLGAVVIPAATLSLAEDSKQSGSLRVSFHNDSKESVGDAISINFVNGQFENGKKSIELSASDGFHEEGDYSSYGLNPEELWHIKISEAGKSNPSSADLTKLLETSVKPVSK